MFKRLQLDQMACVWLTWCEPKINFGLKYNWNGDIISSWTAKVVATDAARYIRVIGGISQKARTKALMAAILLSDSLHL